MHMASLNTLLCVLCELYNSVILYSLKIYLFHSCKSSRFVPLADALEKVSFIIHSLFNKCLLLNLVLNY